MTEQPEQRPARAQRNLKFLSGALFGTAALAGLALTVQDDLPPENPLSVTSIKDFFQQQSAPASPYKIEVNWPALRHAKRTPLPGEKPEAIIPEIPAINDNPSLPTGEQVADNLPDQAPEKIEIAEPAPAEIRAEESVPDDVPPLPRRRPDPAATELLADKGADAGEDSTPPVIGTQPETLVAPAADTPPLTPDWVLADSPEMPHNRIPAEMAEIEAGLEQDKQAILALLAAEGKAPPSPTIQDGITYASAYTGVDEIYLYRLAHAESTFREKAHNNDGGGRGACGLYQFRVSSTYLEAIYKHGNKFPEEYSHLADTVEQTRSRRSGKTTYKIKNGVDKQQVYDACYDARFSSLLAAFFTIDLKNAIENKVELERPVTHADLYIAHFLGINGGPRLINIYEQDDKRERLVSNYVSKSQRNANRGIFNNVKTVEDFYNFFVEQKGMTDSPFDLGEAQFSLSVRFNLPDIPPLPKPRPEREEIPASAPRFGGPV